MAAANFNPFMQYTKNDGTLCAGGSLVFTDPQTDLAKNVYSDSGLSVSLGNTVELNSAGRAATDIFLDGDYNCELLDADDVQVALRENINIQGASAISLPDPATADEDQVLSSDGVDWVFRTIRELPDPTGQSGKYVGSDGELGQYEAFPAAISYTLPAGGVAIASGEIRMGTTLVKYGSDTAPSNASSLSTTKGILFTGTAFTTAPKCFAVPTAVSVTSQGAQVASACTSESTAGFTANFFAGAENTGSGGSNGDKISSNVTFNWFAVGDCAAP